VPESATSAFELYETHHVNELRWKGKKNGDLLRAAKEHGFDVLVTADVNLYHQQKVALYGVAVLVLRIFQNTLEGVLPLVPETQMLIAALEPGAIQYLYIHPRLRESDQRRGRGEFAT
jgi:hypothetical protein